MEKLNIVIATHGSFGAELIKSAEMIVGAMENVHSISLLPEKSFEDFMKEAEGILSELKSPTVVLVDLFGGTPSNVFTVLTQKYEHHVVTGLNLPMLVNLYLENSNGVTKNSAELVESCITTARESAIYTNDKIS